MKSILYKEINSFFASLIGYLIIGLFLICTGLLLWVFEGPFNIPNSGFSDLSPLFYLAPYLFIFLIAAITMRSFSEEQKMGTLELLLTKPISTTQLVLGKFFGALSVIFLAIIPTLIYVIAIYYLGQEVGNIDFGVTLGSYFGLFFLASIFTSIGIFCSTLSENQIVSFVVTAGLIFLFYFGFDSLSNLEFTPSLAKLFSQLSIATHYQSISRGVIDSRDLIYFASTTGLFIYFTIFRLNNALR